MYRSLNISRSVPRSAFTLVELLVSMSIIIILATLTVAGFRASYDADRVGEAASTLRSRLEGARSRAIKAGEQRGLRLLLDPNDNRIVTSVVYIGPPDTIEGNLRVEYDNRDPSGSNSEPGSNGQWRIFDVSEDVDSLNIVNWRDLYNRGLLQAYGSYVEIEIGGSWQNFTLKYRSTDGGGPNDDAWVLASPFPNHDPVTAGGPEGGLGGLRPKPTDQDEVNQTTHRGLYTAVASMPLKYKLHLLPAMLEGAAPAALPPNTCIDLDGSKLPTGWRPGSTTPPVPNRKYGPLSNSSPLAVRPMDILFTPNGAVSRNFLAEGFLIFRLAHRADVAAVRTNLPAYFPNIGINPVVVADPEYPAKLVTLVTQTGMLRISNPTSYMPSDSVSNNEVYTSTNPYRDAIRGKEAKQ